MSGRLVMSDTACLTIGKVVAHLKDRYPDISISKIRYLENEGLLDPARTKTGYRVYSSYDIKRLEDILYLQKHKFMPLSVIKEKLQRTQELQSRGTDVPALEDEQILTPSHRLYPLDRIPQVIGVSISFTRQLVDAGLIHFKRSPHGRDLVDSRDFDLIKTCDELTHYSIGPKNLRQYVIAANRESALFEHALVIFATKAGGVDVQQTKQNRERFDKVFNKILSLTGSIRNQLIRKAIQQTFNTKSDNQG